MLESRGVIRKVAAITQINGDTNAKDLGKGNTFEVFGNLKNVESAKAIDKAFSHGIAGKGHIYEISRREEGAFKRPNGQVTRSRDGTGFEADVDYVALINVVAHNTKGNADVRRGQNLKRQQA